MVPMQLYPLSLLDADQDSIRPQCHLVTSLFNKMAHPRQSVHLSAPWWQEPSYPTSTMLLHPTRLSSNQVNQYQVGVLLLLAAWLSPRPSSPPALASSLLPLIDLILTKLVSYPSCHVMYADIPVPLEAFGKRSSPIPCALT